MRYPLFDNNAKKPASRANLYYLPEKFMPSNLLKAREFLALSLEYYEMKYDKDRALKLAERLELNPKALDWQVKKCSKGMTQKLGLMGALMAERDLLLLDEPMSGLDPSARVLLKQCLLDYRAEGRTVFFSSHILADIDEICDRIAVIHDSKLIFLGKPAEFRKTYHAGKPDAPNALEQGIPVCDCCLTYPIAIIDLGYGFGSSF